MKAIAIAVALVMVLAQSAQERQRAGEFVEAAGGFKEQLRQPGLSGTATAVLPAGLGYAYRSAGRPADAELPLPRAAAIPAKAKDRGLRIVIRQQDRGAARGKVALAGFSLGGHLSLRPRGQVPMVVKFFAPHPAEHVPIHHGNKHRRLDVPNAGLIDADLRRETAVLSRRCDCGAGHDCTAADQDNTEARKLSKERKRQFVAQHLRRQTPIEQATTSL